MTTIKSVLNSIKQIPNEIQRLTEAITIIGETLIDAKIRKQKTNELTITNRENNAKSVVPKTKTHQKPPKKGRSA